MLQAKKSLSKSSQDTRLIKNLRESKKKPKTVHPGNQEKKKVQKKPQGKKPKPVKKEIAKQKKSKYYSFDGELKVGSSVVDIVASREFRSPELVLDSKGNSFGKSTVVGTINGKESMILLDAEQTEIILKTMGVVACD